MTKNLFRISLSSLTLLAFAGANASAAPVQCSTLSQTLQAYFVANTGGGCISGDKLFSNFVFAFTGGVTPGGGGTAPNVPDPNSVTVSDVLGAGPVGMPSSVTLGFTFTSGAGAAQVAAFQTLDLKIQYLVDTINPSGLNAKVSAISGSLTGSNQTGAANVNLIKNDCAGNGSGYTIGFGNVPTNSCIGGSNNSIVNLNGTNSALPLVDGTVSGSVSGLNLTQAGVYDEVSVNGGTGATGNTITAEAANITNGFGESYQAPSGVPEPGTMALFGGALIGLGIFGRKRISRVK